MTKILGYMYNKYNIFRKAKTIEQKSKYFRLRFDLVNIINTFLGFKICVVLG